MPEDRSSLTHPLAAVKAMVADRDDRRHGVTLLLEAQHDFTTSPPRSEVIAQHALDPQPRPRGSQAGVVARRVLLSCVVGVAFGLAGAACDEEKESASNHREHSGPHVPSDEPFEHLGDRAFRADHS